MSDFCILCGRPLADSTCDRCECMLEEWQASAPVSTSARAEVITAETFLRDGYAGKIAARECVVTDEFGGNLISIVGLFEPYCDFDYLTTTEIGQYHCYKDNRLTVQWLPVTTASDEGGTGEAAIDWQERALKAESHLEFLQEHEASARQLLIDDGAISQSSFTLEELVSQLLGRVDYQKAQKEGWKAKSENLQAELATVRQQLRDAQAANGALSLALGRMLNQLGTMSFNLSVADDTSINRVVSALDQVADVGRKALDDLRQAASADGSASAASADDENGGG